MALSTVLTLLDWNYMILAFMLGAIVGSFLNVVILRLPKEEDLLGRTPSHCPKCGHKIRWYDNVPIFSYVFLLRGKCRDCGEKISCQYPLVEFLTGCAFLWIYLRYSDLSMIGLQWLFVAALIAIVFIDLEHWIIPDKITLPGITIALAVSLFTPYIDTSDAVIGMLAGGGFFYSAGLIGSWVAKKEAMGGGDVKMAAMMGAFLGWKPLIAALVVAVFSCAIISIVLMLARKGDRKGALPFGPFLAAGALFCVYVDPYPMLYLLFPYLA